MGRPHAAWLVGLPLVAAAWLSAHGLAYELAAPAAAPVHGYLAHVPLVVAASLVLGAAALFAGLGRRGRSRALSPWLCALFPVAGFAVQEHLERALAGGGALWATATEPVFLVGLLLQLPFGLSALVVARCALAAADAVARPQAPRRVPRALPLVALPRSAELLPAPALALGRAERAPPGLG